MNLPGSPAQSKWHAAFRSLCVNPVVVLIVLTLSVSCREEKGRTENPEEGPPVPRIVIKAPAPVYGSPAPFWFELSPLGPVIIPSPGEASLNPFLPWNHARHITSFLPGDSELLFAGVNRGGILEFKELLNEASVKTGEIAVYYHQGGAVWEAYPLVSLFRYEQRPAALLSGDRFFSAEKQGPPDPSLWTVSFGLKLQALALPALEAFPPAHGWETPVFFQGHDSCWYFRELRRGTDAESGISAHAESFYFRTVDISLRGEEISAASFLEAAEPAGPEKAPPLLALVLEEAARLAGKTCTVAAVSPEFSSRRLYRSGPDTASADLAEELELAGYYRPAGGNRDGLAIVLFPDGRGVYGISGGGPVRDGHFRLPALSIPSGNEAVPSGEAGTFSYTGVALTGDLLVAAWEEQAAWNVGAAGFMMLEIDL
jgi:hypothetical protein